MSYNQDNERKLFNLLNKYNLTAAEKEEFLNIIVSIYKHDEFQKRMTSEFPHHENITLGEHIIEDAIVTYLLSKKHRDEPYFQLTIATKIAMLHDLYTLPWQNNPDNEVKHFSNKHGFRHPIEAVINANTWYPEIFETYSEAEKIIDGIVHHMYPLPVRSLTDDDLVKNNLELKNFDKIKNLTLHSKIILTRSSNRNKIGPFSLCKSEFKEGIIMSKVDSKVSTNNYIKNSNINGLMSLLTGHNKNLEQKQNNSQDSLIGSKRKI